MCSSRSVKSATKGASQSLVKNVNVRRTTSGLAVLPGGSTGKTMDDFIASQKKSMQKYVDVQDVGQFQYANDTTGDIVKTPEIEQQLKAKESTLNVRTSQVGKQDVDIASYSIPAQLRIKRNWSVRGPGGVAIPSMNVNMPSLLSRTDQSSRLPTVRIAGGKISYA